VELKSIRQGVAEVNELEGKEKGVLA